MTPPPTPVSNGPLDVPRWLDLLYKWSNVLVRLALIVGVVTSYFLGVEKGPVVAGLAVGLWLLFYLTSRIIRQHLRDIDLAGKAVSEAQQWTPDKQKEVLNRLRSAKFWTTVSTGILGVIAIAALALQLTSPVYHLIATRMPSTIEFETIQYLTPANQLALFQTSPFLEGVLTSLNNEGEKEQRKTKIILFITKNFPHPTPAFRLNLSVNQKSYEIAGYAFRQQKGKAGTVYEPVLISYPRENPIEFSVPPSEVQDQLLFLGRLSLLDPTQNFPDTPDQIIQFHITPEQKSS